MREGGNTSPVDDEGHDEHAATSPSTAKTARFFFTGPRDVALLIEATVLAVQRHIERQIGHLPTRGAAMDAMFEHVFETWRPKRRRVPREHRVFELGVRPGRSPLVCYSAERRLD